MNRKAIKRVGLVFTVSLALMFLAAVFGMIIWQAIRGEMPHAVHLYGWAAFVFSFWPPVVLAALFATGLHELDWLEALKKIKVEQWR